MVKLNEILSFESKVDFCITKNAVGTSILLKEKWPIEYERPLSKNLFINYYVRKILMIVLRVNLEF